MEYLQRETIETVIDLANRCYPPHEDGKGWVDPFEEKEIENAFKTSPEEEKLEKFIDVHRMCLPILCIAE